MSFVSTTTLRGEQLKMEVENTEPFVVGWSGYISFDPCAQLNGNWKVVEVKENEFVILEREATKKEVKWCPGVVTIEYPKKKQ